MKVYIVWRITNPIIFTRQVELVTVDKQRATDLAASNVFMKADEYEVEDIA